ncbi:hypothetical protein CHS0354_028551 [Potamilus streckersoni]|uniref:Glycine-rich protein n=1 Tax=Potamilus streckersoni TaxID=2493646 RepID=A0AAE0WD96_9BIVA|nr:hypothetical protein CHS0354_028551 [Potamilus streckersoni]
MLPLSHVIIPFLFITSSVLGFERSDLGGILGNAGYLNGGGIFPGGLLGGTGLFGRRAGLLGGGHVWGRDLIGPIGGVFPQFGMTGDIDREGGILRDRDFGGVGLGGAGDIGDGFL